MELAVLCQAAASATYVIIYMSMDMDPMFLTAQLVHGRYQLRTNDNT